MASVDDFGPRHHTKNMQKSLQGLKEHLHQDSQKVDGRFELLLLGLDQPVLSHAGRPRERTNAARLSASA